MRLTPFKYNNGRSFRCNRKFTGIIRVDMDLLSRNIISNIRVSD